MNLLVLKTFVKCFAGSLLLALLFFGGKIFYYSHLSTESWNWLLIFLQFLISFPSLLALGTNYPIVLTIYTTLTFALICFSFKIYPKHSGSEAQQKEIAQKYKMELSELNNLQKKCLILTFFSAYLLIIGGIGVFLATVGSDVSTGDISEYMENRTDLIHHFNTPECQQLASNSDFNVGNDVNIKTINGENVEKLNNKERVEKCRYYWDNPIEFIDTRYVK
jgi:hypothetical protein